jgi:hypothetical protein
LKRRKGSRAGTAYITLSLEVHATQLYFPFAFHIPGVRRRGPGRERRRTDECKKTFMVMGLQVPERRQHREGKASGPLLLELVRRWQ